MIIVLFSSFALPVKAVHAEPAVAKPAVTITQATTKASSLSSYNITVATSDGGCIVAMFIWQLGATWKWSWSGKSEGNVFDTPLTLQMLKFFQNGTLDFAVTYSPLYLIQYDDINGNGLLDLRTSRAFREEVSPNEIEWTNADTPILTYPLTPVFQFIDFERGVAPASWHWRIGSLQNQAVTVNNTETYEVSWNASAEVPNLAWSFTGSHSETVNTAVNVNFGFHLLLLPDEPQIKYDFKSSGVSWAEGKNVKLALLSAIQYQSKESAIVRTDGESFGFDRTWEFKSRRATISESISNTAKAFITYRPDAVVDGSLQTDAVKTSFQPLFLIPPYASVPSGVYVKGMTPDLTMHGTRWNSYVAFSHQLGLPRFDDSISQDPVIGLEVPLLIAGLGFSPSLLTPQTLTLTTVVVTIAFVLYMLNARRSPKQLAASPFKASFVVRFMGINNHLAYGGN